MLLLAETTDFPDPGNLPEVKVEKSARHFNFRSKGRTIRVDFLAGNAAMLRYA
jgi:hypothetical protein